MTITRRITLLLGIAMVGVGLLLLIGIGFYYGLGLYSYTQLDDLNAALEEPVTLPARSVIEGSILPPDASYEPVQPTVADPTPYSDPQPSPRTGVADAPLPDDPPVQIALDDSTSSPGRQAFAATIEPVRKGTASLISNYASMYPGYQMHPKYWHQPQWAGTDSYSHGRTERPGGFQPVLALNAVARGDAFPARRMRIPIIGVDSAVADLEILDLGDSRQYSTPRNIVGRIPGTANPGESGNGWFFGHLESPIKREGNVFHRLPEIAEHLRNGDPVYMSISTDESEYLYQVVSSIVVHEDDLGLYDTDDVTVTLVTCSNRPFYDYRQLVTAKLVGIRS